MSSPFSSFSGLSELHCSHHMKRLLMVCCTVNFFTFLPSWFWKIQQTPHLVDLPHIKINAEAYLAIFSENFPAAVSDRAGKNWLHARVQCNSVTYPRWKQQQTLRTIRNYRRNNLQFCLGTSTAPQNTKSKDQCFTKEELQYPVTSVLARNEGKGEGLMQWSRRREEYSKRGFRWFQCRWVMTTVPHPSPWRNCSDLQKQNGCRFLGSCTYYTCFFREKPHAWIQGNGFPEVGLQKRVKQSVTTAGVH